MSDRHKPGFMGTRTTTIFVLGYWMTKQWPIINVLPKHRNGLISESHQGVMHFLQRIPTRHLLEIESLHALYTKPCRACNFKCMGITVRNPHQICWVLLTAIPTKGQDSLDKTVSPLSKYENDSLQSLPERVRIPHRNLD